MNKIECQFCENGVVVDGPVDDLREIPCPDCSGEYNDDTDETPE